MTVKEIIKKHLDDNGFDGLYADECGCSKDDLFPCESTPENCQPGYKQPCTCGESYASNYGGHDWHIGPDKQPTA